jgi:hypothetical protein
MKTMVQVISLFNNNFECKRFRNRNMNPLKCPRVTWIGIQVIGHVETYHLGLEDTDKLSKILAVLLQYPTVKLCSIAHPTQALLTLIKATKGHKKKIVSNF